MTRVLRILREAGLWFLGVVVILTIAGPPLTSKGILLFAGVSLVFGVFKEFMVVSKH